MRRIVFLSLESLFEVCFCFLVVFLLYFGCSLLSSFLACIHCFASLSCFALSYGFTTMPVEEARGNPVGTRLHRVWGFPVTCGGRCLFGVVICLHGTCKCITAGFCVLVRLDSGLSVRFSF